MDMFFLHLYYIHYEGLPVMYGNINLEYDTKTSISMIIINHNN